jgi:hypothetical protein
VCSILDIFSSLLFLFIIFDRAMYIMLHQRNTHRSSLIIVVKTVTFKICWQGGGSENNASFESNERECDQVSNYHRSNQAPRTNPVTLKIEYLCEGKRKQWELWVTPSNDDAAAPALQSQ